MAARPPPPPLCSAPPRKGGDGRQHPSPLRGVALRAAKGREGVSARHRFTSQVVTGSPPSRILAVLELDAHASSSSRMRSDSAEILGAASGEALLDCLLHEALVDLVGRGVRRCKCSLRSAEADERERCLQHRHSPVRRSRCSSAIACETFRSSASASMTVADGSPGAIPFSALSQSWSTSRLFLEPPARSSRSAGGNASSAC